MNRADGRQRKLLRFVDQRSGHNGTLATIRLSPVGLRADGFDIRAYESEVGCGLGIAAYRFSRSELHPVRPPHPMVHRRSVNLPAGPRISRASLMVVVP